MFETVMLDSTTRARAQRRWATLLSVTIQIVLVGVLLLLPIIAPESIPRMRFYETLMAPQPEAAGPKAPTPRAEGTSQPPSNPNQPVLQQPDHIPQGVDLSVGEVPEVPSSTIPHGDCVSRCDPGSRIGVPGGTGDESGFIPTVREPDPPPTRVIISKLEQGFLVHRVQPVYPVIPKQVGIQGAVVLRAVISRTGEIQELRVISGHPMLSPAAVDAVKQWRYRPYLLNGIPVEVETQITVNFYLSGR